MLTPSQGLYNKKGYTCATQKKHFEVAVVLRGLLEVPRSEFTWRVAHTTGMDGGRHYWFHMFHSNTQRHCRQVVMARKEGRRGNVASVR